MRGRTASPYGERFSTALCGTIRSRGAAERYRAALPLSTATSPDFPRWSAGRSSQSVIPQAKKRPQLGMCWGHLNVGFCANGVLAPENLISEAFPSTVTRLGYSSAGAGWDVRLSHGRDVSLATIRMPGFQRPTAEIPTPPSDHTPLGGVVRFRVHRATLPSYSYEVTEQPSHGKIDQPCRAVPRGKDAVPAG